MGVMPTPPLSRPLTLEDFEAIRDVEDGHRYELIDGVLVVTPSPVPRHQQVVTELLFLLRSTITPGHRVYAAPLDVRLGTDTVVQPDLLVAAPATVTAGWVDGPPALVVEVLSPSTRSFDLGAKLLRYEQAGTPSYWVVDPDEPSLRAWELDADGYREVARAAGDEVAELARPWPLRVVPADLAAGDLPGPVGPSL
ncbi:Uma2 family endonuclease [Ornithinicoccus hortensis]|uniref:Uma2 family endonuclease n=2 Tax=Ornithinicoccus hortensis TaxID=82346 RepID=A0A542YMH0_9MICO|nr:Uma2 family endonuclease [Ornithinicoccus hortensis]